jgi:hypothetical protein
MFLISLGIIGLGEELKGRKIVRRTWITSTETNDREASNLDYNVWLACFNSERPPLQHSLVYRGITFMLFDLCDLEK